jgi:hypothetical protein
LLTLLLLLLCSSETKIVRQQARNAGDYATFDSQIFDQTENFTTIGYSLDRVNKVFWFGGFVGKVYKVVVNETDFANSAYTIYNLPTEQNIVAVYADTTHGFLYAVTRGNASDPTTVFFYNVGVSSNQFVLESNVTCDVTDYDAVSIAVDPLGVMYIGTTQSPPSIIQIDIPNRNYESTFRLGPEAGPQRFMMHDPISNSIYAGSYDIASRISVVRYAAAAACESNCYSHGTCTDRRCACVNGTSDLTARPYTWQQPWCQTRPCDFDSSNGLICGGPLRSIGCNNGTCLCSANYTGALCQTRQCARNCSGAGTCNIVGESYTCSCSEGRGGDDCALITKLPCYRYDTCSGCMENPSCGWCEAGAIVPFNSTVNASRCIEGSRLGPSNGYLGCRSWHFQECPSIAITVGSAIIAALVGLMFAINAISFIWEDSGSDRPAKRMQWYRFQRSSKAYAALWQLQYFAVVTILAGTVVTYPSPTAFISYTRVWLPITGVHGFGITGPRNLFLSTSSNNTINENGGVNTQATGVTQSLVYADLMENSIMRGVMATWAVLVAIMLVVYVIFYCILALVRGSERFMEVLSKRPLYILLRAVEIGYFPIVVFGAVQLSYAFREPAWAALGGVFYVVIGILYPLGLTALVTFIQKSTLFKEEFILMFYPFYGNMDHKKAIFSILPWAKKFIIASAFGFGIFSLLGQVITTLIVCIAYAVAILFLRPYVDYLHQYMDIATAVLTALSTLPLFAFTILDLSPGGILGATLVFVIFNVLSVAACIGFYIYSWCQMKGIFALSQCARCLSCSDDS